MSELDRETEGVLWKVRALLMMRALYRKKVISIRDVATEWKITERDAFRKLAEADSLFKALAPLLKMQPDLNDKPTEPLAENMQVTD